MELRHYLDIVKRQKWLIISAVVIVAAVAAFVSYRKTSMYAASARVLLKPGDANEQLYPGYYTSGGDYSDPDRYVAAQMDIVASEAVAADAAKNLPAVDPYYDGVDAGTVQGAVSVSQSGSSDILDVTGTSSDPLFARDAANEVAKAYIENRRVYSVAALKNASDEIQTKLTDLEKQIGTYDAQINGAPVAFGATPTVTPPSSSGITGPQDAGIPPPDSSGLDQGAQPADSETLKAARFAAATQYQSLFFRQQELQVEMSLKRGEAELITQAADPGAPFSPAPRRDGVLGAFVGLLLGLGFAFVREQLDDRIRSTDDAERANNLPILAELPVDPEADKHPELVAAALMPQGAMAESVRSLRTSLEFLGVDEPLRRIVVTSPGPGDGKSLVAANLGVVYANAGYSTVVVSSDLRRPRVDTMLGGEPDCAGLTTVLANAPARREFAYANGEGNGNGNGNGVHDERPDRDALLGALRPTSVEKLQFLPSGPLPPNPSELMGSRRMVEVLDALREFAEVVILDTPPLLAVTDAAALAPNVDAVLLVNSVGATKRSAARKARSSIDGADVRVTGLVVNRVERSKSSYYGYYYSQDGARTKLGRRRQRAKSERARRKLAKAEAKLMRAQAKSGRKHKVSAGV